MKSDSAALRSDPTAAFLLGLERSGFHPLIGQVNGSIMLQLAGPGGVDHWLVVLDKGHVGVANRAGPADAVVRIKRELFASVALGRSNLWAAFLRNDLQVEGELRLLVVFQRLLPSPPPEEDALRGRDAGR